MPCQRDDVIVNERGGSGAWEFGNGILEMGVEFLDEILVTLFSWLVSVYQFIVLVRIDCLISSDCIYLPAYLTGTFPPIERICFR